QLRKIECRYVPVDWSLKTKVRFTSPIPFPSRGSFRTFEEVNGTVGFVRCLHSEESDKRRSGTHSSHGAKFFQQCLVWMHPSLPWLNLFPRVNNRSVKQNNCSVILDSVAQEILHSTWCDSFRSLYQLVRLFQCPYFYMCTETFTVLFRCAGAASVPVIHALISPTTKGFRKALKEEGIAFTMPLCQKSDDSGELTDENLDSSHPEENGENKATEESDDDIEDDEPETWLEKLGLSQDDFPSLNKKKRRSEMAYKIDHKPESLVYVEDSETQALVNFLLNSQLCTSKIGPMAGIPPTLLAPTAFLGGTLQSLKISHGKVKNEDKELDSVEINGPLLPNTIHSLCSLFNATQEGNFSAVLTTHAPTSAFSMVTPQSPILPCIFAKNNLTDCGLPEAFVQQMCSNTEELTIRNITADNGLFSWK
ncbi:protein downstream neighbor of son homolog, partial [Stegodyphus dumicola]|uniref:protein downstream neighbor of son homolog n=1 Tax=Stegodyphus dumicola TaxID=202533 RepID=UPI0015B1C996